ncbi:hypothetical protein JOF56_003784 [Kibdelosporangium banguiense]|uniref:Tetratricopeptide repeat protein n=1 Tax=Kibdelosporangium banguiense TaxID=1365924 RepID=A0ABS4TG53_9PSEU|nr:hypothetical protein [Kibdelosporangium banguiense]MBP2323399.1 hypothetical protein [Kibdelosporangium banguiense]
MRTVCSGTYLVIAVVTAVVAIEWSRVGIVFGLLGALVGAIVTFAVIKLGLLVGALLFGVRVHGVVIGIGPRVAEWRVVSVRALPLALSVDVGPGRLPARRRLVGAALVSVFAGLAAVVTFGFVAGLGMALGGAAALIKSMVPDRMSTGWLLFRQPWAEMTPGVLQVFDLVQAGELDAAERLVSQLSVAHPQMRAVRASRVLVLEARGRYAEALTLAIGMSSDAEQHDAAAAMATVAGLTGAAIEAGQLAASDGLPVAARALHEAIELGNPSYMLDGARALIALLAGDPQLAVQLARMACNNNHGSLGRADHLATLARAYMAAGDNSAARRTLAKAERLVPWWPRVALTRRRLDLA